MTDNLDTLYDRLVAARCEIDHHESDLYVLDTRLARQIIADFKADLVQSGQETMVPSLSTFLSPKDNRSWIDLPFQYSPFWRSAYKAPNDATLAYYKAEYHALNDDQRAIVDTATSFGASFVLRNSLWHVTFPEAEGDVDGPFTDLVDAARSYCEANKYPLPSSGNTRSI